MAGDPLGTGLVPSLNRPGGNVTGVSLMAAELFGKCVEIVHDLLPTAHRVAALGNGQSPNGHRLARTRMHARARNH